MKSIIIHYDFTTGEEVSFGEGKKLDNFKTHCLQFFNTEGDDVTIIRKDGRYINNLELLKNVPGEYTEKEIRKAHNIRKIFVAGGFEWKKGD